MFSPRKHVGKVCVVRVLTRGTVYRMNRTKIFWFLVTLLSIATALLWQQGRSRYVIMQPELQEAVYEAVEPLPEPFWPYTFTYEEKTIEAAAALYDFYDSLPHGTVVIFSEDFRDQSDHMRRRVFRL